MAVCLIRFTFRKPSNQKNAGHPWGCPNLYYTARENEKHDENQSQPIDVYALLLLQSPEPTTSIFSTERPE
jgi:hypothetical protein